VEVFHITIECHNFSKSLYNSCKHAVDFNYIYVVKLGIKKPTKDVR
jgi:hypothetical protein